MREAPAAIPAGLLLFACAVAPGLRPSPAWAIVALAAAAIALGGRVGWAAAAVAAGLWLGEQRRSDPLPAVAGLPAEIEGRVCGGWRVNPDHGGRSARLCADWLQVRSWRTLAPPRLWLDLSRDVAPLPAEGARVRARGTLSRFPGLANATPVLPGPWRLRVKSERMLRSLAAPRLFDRAHAAIGRRLDAALRATGVAETAGVALARALVLGDESALGEGRRRALRRAGLAHLFAVSGFNLTLLAAFTALVAGFGGRGLRAGLPAIAVLLYLTTVGTEPSMLRASVMAAVALGIFLLRRWTSPAQSLSIAALAIGLADPTLVDEVGFRLSVGATAGLVLAASRWQKAMRCFPRALSAGFAASFAAQAGALPFSVSAFGEVAPLAPLWNLVAVPWAALWLLAGMLWLTAALVSPAAAAAVAPLLDLGAAPFGWLERLPPSGWLSVPLSGGLAAGLALSALLAILFESDRARRLAPACLAALACAGGTPPPVDHFEVAFLDVAQGDAALVLAHGFTALVDGGGLPGRDLGTAALRPALARRGLSRLDVAILSHSDRDHCQGLVDLAALIPIGELWSSPEQLERGCGARLAARIRGPVLRLAAGRRIERSGVTFDVWHPPRGRVGAATNSESLVVAVSMAGRRFVFTGDVAAPEERLALDFAAGMRADVLKVSHHGAAGSTSAAWLAVLRPRLAVVSSGSRNPYGHPASATLERLRASGSRVLRTDRDGEIVLRRQAGRPWSISLPGDPRPDTPGG